MLELLLGAHFTKVKLHHVRMAFSKSLNEVGQFRLAKLFHLVSIILRVYVARWCRGFDVLYYPPAGPNRIPMWRDIVILNCTRWMFRKTIFHMHASGVSLLYDQLSPVAKWLFRRAYFGADAMIRPSSFIPNDSEGLRAKREFIISNATDDAWPRFQKESQAKSTTTCRILYMGTVCRTKGILVLLDACREMAKANVPFHLDVVGGFQPTGFEQEVRDAIAASALADHVTIWGQQVGDAKWERFARASLFCFPTYYESESFPCVLVEALSFGLPIVSTRWRGIPSIVTDGVDGILVPPQNSKMLAQALLQLVSNASLRQQLGTAGREKYLEKFTPTAHLDCMEKTLAMICLPNATT